jgi:hypothetical protein
MVSVFTLINEAVLGICDVQEKIVNHEYQPKQQNPPVTARSDPPGNAKKPRNDHADHEMIDLASFLRHSDTGNKSSGPANRTRDPDPEYDPAVSAFKEAVKEAEKSTVIFNLNLGRVPIVNQDTISTNVTKALTSLAAEAESDNRGSTPSNNTIAILDDALSVVTGMKFFGKKTYSYKRDSDPNSGSYCKIPVRYDFQDKEVRQFAESVFRDKCKVQCSTPYPVILRECIKQVINQAKSVYPNNFVSVTVDTNKMLL